ncbi:HAMP domain-containing sensor histidine kinase [Chitinophaga sp. SYP-B3965]|uniref:sensor histidine kinase n=1 Tax=Chitinophaga sp. SYP-B3965 TaxID=2663120 RepID=UPI001563C142|nr:HAMP domain-containing sensor histidine kinase [Chitinophaga sp. SYP-B3965]
MAANDILDEQSSNEIMKSIFRTTLHEIGTPINAVVSASRLLKLELDNGNTEFAHELIQMIFSSSNYLHEIFERVRLAAQQENMQKFQMDEIIFDFRKWVDNLLHSMAAMFMEKEISIVKRVSEDFPATIYSDKTYLTQIIYNILSNALKYSPKSSGVTIVCFVRDKNTACIEITDQGIGIPTSELPHIFKEYHQIVSGYKTKFGGMGLGLSIAKNLTEVMGGNIEVKSEVGEGSTFTVTLPLKK